MYSNVTSSNSTSPRTSGSGCAAGVLLVLGRHLADLADAIEAGERLGHLRADVDASWTTGIVISAVNDRYMTKSPIVIVPLRIDVPPTSIIAMPIAPMTSAENAVDGRHAGQRLRDVAEQPVRALREDELLALLGRVGLDDADAAERFGEPAGDLGVDLAALAEERPQPLERRRHAAAERAEDRRA